MNANRVKFLDTTISENQPPVYNVNKIEDCIMELHDNMNKTQTKFRYIQYVNIYHEGQWESLYPLSNY